MGDRTGRTARARVAWAVIGTVPGLLVLVSCAGGASAMGSSPGPASAAGSPVRPAPVSSTAPSSVVGVARRAAATTYMEMWQAMAQAAQTSDFQYPLLAQYASGEALGSIVRSLYADHARHVVSRGAPLTDPVVRSVSPPDDPTTVVITDCGDSRWWVKYHEGTDDPAGDGPGGGRRAITAEVLRQPDGSWRVNRVAVQGLGSC